MPDIAWAALITAGLGGLFSLVLRYVDRKTENAKIQSNKNTLEVTTIRDAMTGLQILANEQRSELGRKDERIRELEEDLKSKERDLLEEKALNISLARENDRLRGEA